MTNGRREREQEHEVNEDHPETVYEESSRSETAASEPREHGVRGREGRRTPEDWPDRRSRGEQVSETASEIWAGGSTFEAIAGAGAVVLTILGLVEILPVVMVSIATIAVGVGMMFGGASIAAKYREALEASQGDPGSEKAELGGGLSTEILGGAAGAVLGLLALLNVADPLVLIPAAVIALGGAIMFGAGATSQMRDVAIRRTSASRSSQRFASESVSAAASTQVFVGVGAAALGILALADIAPALTLSLVGMLALGASALISGAAIGGRMMQRFAY